MEIQILIVISSPVIPPEPVIINQLFWADYKNKNIQTTWFSDRNAKNQLVGVFT